MSARATVTVLCLVSALAMLYVGAYQIRAIEHLSCPLLKGGCEAVADAPFARPFGIPDGFIAAALYGLIVAAVWLAPNLPGTGYFVRALAIFAALANVLGVYDMARFGAYCFYCLITTLLAPFLVWAAFRL